MKKSQKVKTAALRLNNKEIFDVFNPDINWKKTYCAYFQKIPNSKTISSIDITKVHKWFEKNHFNRILKKFKSERFNRKRNSTFDEVIYILDNECMMCLNYNNGSYVEIFYSTETPEIIELTKSIRRFKQKPEDSFISIVVSEMHGLSLTSLKVKRPQCVIEKNYNDDLVQLHEHIMTSLQKKDCSGLSLFYGTPGTGKSTYIRHLIGFINKKVIFLPPKLAGNMDDPHLIRLLIENPDSIIVIEDAEDLLVSRDSHNNSAISMLLNLTDGLLGSSLGIHFICTFNTQLGNIDKALLRKGRLTTLYEFKPLLETKSKELLRDFGINDFNPPHSMTLAEIYNVREQEFEYSQKMRAVGFSSKVA